MIEIKIANTETIQVAEVQLLYDIIIEGYAVTEKEVWGNNYVRIFPDDYHALIKKNEILVALYNGKVAGGIHVYPINSKIYTFSLLATNFQLKGKGIGSALIYAVEQMARENGAEKVTLEILRVKNIEVDSKTRLANFYKRLGYSYTNSEDCICKIPLVKYQKLLNPSDFDFYEKVL